MINKYYTKKGLPTIKCLNCGAEIKTTGLNQKYCLNIICQKAKKRKWTQKNYKERRSNLPSHKKCLTCKKEFNFQKHKKYCSKSCYIKSIKSSYIKRGAYSINKNCIICGNIYIAKSPIQKYCSYQCGKLTRFTLKTRFEILKRDNFTCQYCGRTIKDNITLQIDHIIPKSKNGTNNIKNLITSCNLCNLGKSNKF